MTVINLNRFRKKKQREEAQRKAEANAIRHGGTKAERERLTAERERREAKLDGAKLDDAKHDDDEPQGST